MPQPPSPAENSYGFRGALVLAAVAAGVWLVLLPAVGNLPAVKAHIARNEALGIDPSAKFYTEVDAVRTARVGLESLGRRDAGVLWNRTAAPAGDCPCEP